MDTKYIRERWFILESLVREDEFREQKLESRVLERAENIEKLPDGTIQFKIVRHAHLDGLRSKGKPSSAYQDEIHTYEFSPDNKLDVINVEADGEPKIDWPSRAEEEVELVLEGIIIERDVPELLAEVTPEGRESKAEKYSEGILWEIQSDYKYSDEEQANFRYLCIESLTEKLLHMV